MSETTVLPGVRAHSLGGYFAGLGLARICSTQLRSSIMSSWSPRGLVLHGISDSELVEFLTERYSPAPIVSPWAGGSGFSEGEDTSAIDTIRKSTDPRLERYRSAIAQVTQFPELPPRGWRVSDIERWAADRLENQSSSNKERRELTELLAETKKLLATGRMTPTTPLDNLKQGNSAAKLFTQFKSQRRHANKSAIAARCRNELPDDCLAWLDASVILFMDNKGELAQVNGVQIPAAEHHAALLGFAA